MHQPAWLLFGAVRLAGVRPTSRGWRIDPSLPLTRFDLRLPGVGVARERGRLRGYVRAERDGSSELQVVAPARVRGLRAWVGRRRATARVDGRVVTFTLDHRAGRPADWAVTWR